MGRDAVTQSALLTLGPRRMTRIGTRWGFQPATRTNSACGCFVGEPIAGGEHDDTSAVAICEAVYEDAAIEAVFLAHEDNAVDGAHQMLVEEVESYLGFTVEELQAAVPLPEGAA